jgi:hypothetical protein
VKNDEAKNKKKIMMGGWVTKDNDRKPSKK